MNKTLAVVSLERGSGKSTLALNIASLLFSRDSPSSSVLLLDMDFQGGGVTKLLGLVSLPYSISHLTNGTLHPLETAYRHPVGFHIIPNFCEHKKYSSSMLTKNLQKLENSLIVIDSNSGNGLIGTLELADNFIIIGKDVPKIKQLSMVIENNGKTVLGAVLNNISSLSTTKTEEIERKLGKKVIGVIPAHKAVREANSQNQPVSYLYGECLPVKKFRNIISNLDVV